MKENKKVTSVRLRPSIVDRLNRIVDRTSTTQDYAIGEALRIFEDQLISQHKKEASKALRSFTEAHDYEE